MRKSTGKSTETEMVTPRTMLDRCLVDGDAAAMSSGRRQRRKALGLSLAIETSALALLLIAPLMSSIAQPKFSNPTSVPFVFGIKHAPDAGLRHHDPTTPPVHHYIGPVNLTPGRGPRPDVQKPDKEEEPTLTDGGWGDRTAGSDELNSDGMRFAELVAPPPPSEIKKSEAKRPMKVSGGVEAAQLVLRIEPRYPPLALQVKKEGTVILHAIINRDGRITALDVDSGPPLLVQAALDAVRQWRYRPTLLHGEPVEVETTITVIFRLQQ